MNLYSIIQTTDLYEARQIGFLVLWDHQIGYI